MKTDVLVIGGGSAGMAAALSAVKHGAKAMIIERDGRLGGILNQCIHNGFGLKYFKTEMTGPEYANAWIEKVKAGGIEVCLETSVTGIKRRADGGFNASVISPKGAFSIAARAVVLAMGCRERPSAAIGLCGTRPVGVMTAGSAQKMINIYGKMIGKRVVIVGSGDVGLIMARRLHFEGAHVLGVYEIGQTPSGLNRNIVQCLKDFNIPLHLGETVMEVVGSERVEGVYVAKVNPDFSFNLKTRRFVKCDTVLLSVGLVPENDLVEKQILLSPITGGAVVDDRYMTSEAGVFACGNALHVHDIVDDVTAESELAGACAGQYAIGQIENAARFKVQAGEGVRYTVPSYISAGSGFIAIKFRVSKPKRDAEIVVKCGDAVIGQRKANIVLPAQMEQIMVDRSKFNGDIVVEVR